MRFLEALDYWDGGVCIGANSEEEFEVGVILVEEALQVGFQSFVGAR